MPGEFQTTPPQGGVPIVGRPIINANIGVTNRVEAEDIHTIMMDTFQDIARVLSDHCGPYGQFAMIVDPSNRVAEPVFTKDGIGIVRSIEYMSVMQEFVRDTLAYMGSRIETAAGDGTTSSMIICAVALHSLITNLKGHLVSYNELVNKYNWFADVVCNELDTESKLLQDFGEVDQKEKVYRIAYSQAYTSSHGNHELSKAVAELFAETPKEAWNYLYIDKCKYESDKLYNVAIDETQYTCENVMIWPTGMLSEDMGTARKRENVEIELSGIAPSFEKSYLDGYELYEKICKKIESGEEYALICPAMIDGATTNSLNELFQKHPDHKVVIFKVNIADPRLNDIVCMKTLNNNFGLKTTFTGSYDYRGGDLKILSGLYENTTDSKLNPMVGNPNYPEFNQMLSNLDKVIEQIKKQVANRTLNRDVANLQKLRLKLMVSRRSYFLIGGSAYDSSAAVDVVIDAILAVKNTLTKGYGLGGNKTLYHVLKKGLKTYNTMGTNWYYALFANAFLDGIKTVHEASVKWYVHKPPFNEEASFDIAKWPDLDFESDTCVPGVGNYAFTNHFVYPKKLMDESSPWKLFREDQIKAPIIQPIIADKELVKRFGELALKFVKTCRIIAPGGLVSNKKIDTISEQNPS